MNHYWLHGGVSFITELAEICCLIIEIILHWNVTFCWRNELSESERGTLQTWYFSLIHFRVLYGITAWGPAIHNNENNKTFRLLKRTIRIINKMAHRSHTDPLFKTCKIIKISDVYEQQFIIFVYVYETNKFPMPFKNMFRHNYDIRPQMHTRRASNIYTDISRNKFVENLPNFIIPKLWNKWM